MTAGRVKAIAVAACAAVALTGCELKDDGDNVFNGKALFVEKCAACHTLSRAGAKGLVGPNLDEAWQQAQRDGFGRSTFRGLVHRQILHPNNDPQVDPDTGKFGDGMPANLVTGEDAKDVAAYVAQVAAVPGEDTGRLARAGATKNDEVAKAEGGKLEIPADPSGRTAYLFGGAEAPAGALTLSSPNKANVPHNIAVEGNGLDEKGPVVQDGGVSTIDLDLKPGKYTFYCSVPGHREGGMQGTLTVQ